MIIQVAILNNNIFHELKGAEYYKPTENGYEKVIKDRLLKRKKTSRIILRNFL